MNAKIGDKVVFKGYGDDVSEAEQFLVAGETYEVIDVNDEDDSIVVRVDNPDFNPKKKESESNASTMLVDVFAEEYEVKAGRKAAAKPASKAKAKAAPVEEEVEEEEEAEEPEEEPEEEEEEEEAPPPKAKPAAKAKATAKAKPAAKAKATTKAKPAPKAKAKAKAQEPEEEADPYADLSEEDESEEVLTLVNEADDLLELAKEVTEEAAATEYKLGGILFHVRKTKAYAELGDEYADKGGFKLYIENQLSMHYRKGMYLIDIYYKTSKYGLDAERMSNIGWAKAAKIAAVMTEDNAEELLELAEENTVADLVENIKTSYKEVGGVKGEKKKMVTFKFRLFEDQAAGVEEVLQSVASGMGYKRLDDAFEHIVMEWAAEHHTAPKAHAETKTAAKSAAKPAAKPKAKAAAK